MTVYIPKSLLSESAASAAKELQSVQSRLSSAHIQLRNGDFARQKSMQDSRLGELIDALNSGPERDSAVSQRRLEQYRSKMAEWDREHGRVWQALEAEISALEAEREQLERYLADYVGVRVGG